MQFGLCVFGFRCLFAGLSRTLALGSYFDQVSRIDLRLPHECCVAVSRAYLVPIVVYSKVFLFAIVHKGLVRSHHAVVRLNAVCMQNPYDFVPIAFPIHRFTNTVHIY